MKPYRFTVGDIDCISISDGHRDGGKAEVYLANAPKDEVEAALKAHNQQADTLPQHFNVFYIKTGDKQLLVDTGMGANPSPEVGNTLERLADEGIQPEDIDIVIVTHAHGDHIGGLMDADGNFTFPNAEYVMWKSEWEHWTSDEMLASNRGEVLRAKLLPIESKLTLIDHESEIVPGVCAIPLPGHTPGHMGLMLESNGERLYHIVDVLHQQIQLAHPNWSPMFDSLPELSPITRLEAFNRAADENLLTMTYHLPFPGLGHIVRQGDAFAWQPVDS